MLVKTLFHRTRLVYKYCSLLRHSNRSFASEATPSQRYNVLVKSFTVKHDENQAIVVQKLDKLYDELHNYDAPQLPHEPDTSSSHTMGTFDVSPSSNNSSSKTPPNTGGILKRFFGGSSKVTNKAQNNDNQQMKSITIHDALPPNGLYIYGSTGTGKTMLLDLFYESITSHKKQRVHFNKFMLEIHDKIHRNTQQLKESGLTPHEMRDYDPIPALSLSIAAESTVLCFDEFQVTDIVDAVLLNRLFTSLFYYGVVCIATSNREPNMLYLNGLQRQQVFVPFLKLFVQKMDVIDLNSIDYRDQGSNLKNTYFEPLKERENEYEEAWKRMIENNPDTEHNKVIDVMAGRKLDCPRSIGNSKATRFKFEELCAANLGSADYLALSKSFSTLFIDNIPYFGFENRNEMKRFILLVDELYNNKNRVVCLAADKAENLFKEKQDNKNVFEDMFQFDRCASRLMEMQTAEYLDDFKHFWRDDESVHVD